MRNKNIIFVLIIIIAAVLRFWSLGNVPLSPDWDEAALGYNAYSIMQTGKDEYGKFFPIILRSFDDYKPALYAYLVVPSIAIFGLSVFAVRLPSAIFGVLAVIATYFLVTELFSSNNSPPRCAAGATPPRRWSMINAGYIALFTSFLLAISPWHLQFSRAAFEANIGLTLNIFAILFFLKGLKKPWFLLLSTTMMGFNLYAYQSEKVLTPLLLFVLIFLFKKRLFEIKKSFTGALVLFLLISLPLIIFTFTNKDTLARARGVSIFSENILLRNQPQKLLDDQARNDKIGQLLDDRRVEYLKIIIANYLSHYDLNWLFIKGDFENNRHHAPNMGLLYLFELPFLLSGIYVLLFGNLSSGIDKKFKILIIVLFLITPIPASVTRDVPHAVRTLHFLPVLQIFTALGIMFFVSKISNIKYQISKIQIKYLIFTMYFLFFIFNFSYYLDQYFVQLNYYYAKDWQYGYKELIDYLEPDYKKYHKILVSNRAPFDQSYMFFLFYLKYNPEKYLALGGTKSGGFKETGNKFDNFEFREFNYYDEKKGNILLIGSSSDFPEIFKTIKEIYYPNGNLAVRVVEKD